MPHFTLLIPFPGLLLSSLRHLSRLFDFLPLQYTVSNSQLYESLASTLASLAWLNRLYHATFILVIILILHSHRRFSQIFTSSSLK